MLLICRVIFVLSILEFSVGNGGIGANNTSMEGLERKANILKKRIELLQDIGAGKLEIVFLIDASSSVGSSNFKSALKFVKKLLANFDVASNNSRVSIITFSDTTKVIRHVDHISVNSDENHKCSLLHSDLPNIPYSSGGTYTLGALLDAQSVLLSSRRDAIKAVFLVTDGFSNGGDPLPVAEILKESGAYLFTFGIHNGNTEELEKIASVPIEDHSYLLQSFGQFEQLARRALHKDLSVSRFQLVNNRSLCDKLCEEEYRDIEYGCCDKEANCACGTQSGHYACVCGPGHYGSGVAGSCSPCPNGTYHDGSQSGDISVCQVCPDVNHYTEIGSAASKKDCKCKQGFISNGDKCEVLTCSPLEAPVHGHFVQGGVCPVAVYAACGIRCDVGYALQGTSIRLCEDNGEWSGDAPMCKAKTCPNLKSPVNGTMNCTEPLDLVSNKMNPDGRAVDTECKFKCAPGYNLIGSHRRHCLPLARWDGLPVSCKPITCPPIPPPPHGLMTPAICHRRVPFGTECSLKCSPGFKVEGVAARKCAGKGGKWTQKNVSSKCVDISPPKISCPENVLASTDIGSKFAAVSWDQPVCEDNSGKKPLVWSETVPNIPATLPIGSNNVTYFAMDASGNKANCSFVVTVIDDEPPTIDFCPTTDPIHLYETDGNATVVWTEPKFYDNSDITPKVFKSHSSGIFPVGSTRVTYIATDEAGNNSTCTFDVIVRDTLCSEVPPKPTFGNTTCVILDDKTKNCSITCLESYILTVNNTVRLKPKEALNYFCSENKMQLTSLPECAETALPNLISQDGTLYQDLSPLCKNMSDFDKIRIEVKKMIESKLEEVCESFDETTCIVQNINARCEESVSAKEEETNQLFSRRRRSTSTQPRDSVANREAKSGSESRIRADFRIELHRNPAPINTTFGTNEFETLRSRLSNRIPNLAWTGQTRFFCDPGFVFLPDGSCVQCPRGSFAPRGSRICHPCPWGQYQDLRGQISCLPCPEGTSTRFEYSRQRSDCRSICRPGTFGRRLYPGMPSVAPCQSCGKGWYQPEVGASSCIQCSAGAIGTKRAATTVQECGQIPVSSAKCSDGFCLNNGNCSLDSTEVRPKCDCLQGFIGLRCLSPPNPCESSPCIHGGSCVPMSPSNYSCVCFPGFTGSNCQVDVDECMSSPCQNNGSCEDLLNGFFCDCPLGFRGERCQVNIDECSVNPCSNYSVCVDGVGSYYCACLHGYTGKHCDVAPVDVCQEIQPCRNRGRCQNTRDGNYTCKCYFGWTGRNCEFVKNRCDDHPCQNGGICELEGNRCSSESCVYCWCRRGYSGQFCEIENTPDFYLRFPNSGTTDYASVRVPPGMYDGVSLCLWLKSDDGFNYGTSFSYATNAQPNSFTLTDYNGLVLYVSGLNVVTDLVINDGMWHHVCVTWRSTDGLWKIYVDGNCRSNGTNLASSSTIQGKGQLVVGQEQDSVGGSFNAVESLVGYVYGLEMWSKMLDAQAIANLANDCQPGQSGDLVTWADMRSGLHGKVEVEPSRFCSACPDPDPPVHGNVTVLNTGHGLVARYICREGFVVQGSTSNTGTLDRMCIKGSHWQGVVPTCVRRSCPRPKPLLGGSVEIHSGFLYEHVVSYKCREGNTLLGSERRVCLADGTWSGEDAMCKGLPCPPVAAPRHGTVSSLGTVTQQLSFSCEPGFRLYGPSLISCLHDGSWNEIAPECVPDGTMCEDLPRIENAIIRRLGQEPNHVEKAQVLCNNIQIAEFECLNSGVWSVVGGTEPVCSPLAGCILPSAPPNGTIISSVAENIFVNDGVTVSVRCNEGFVLDGPSSKTCTNGNFLPSDSWSCDLACNPMDLPHDVPFSKVITSGSQGVLKCTDSYELLVGGPGSSYIQDNITWNCLSSREWILSSSDSSSSREVEYVGCRKKTIAKHCPQPKVPVHGILLWSTDGEQALSVGQSVRLHCEQGYFPVGKTMFSCTEEGVWSGVDNASCQPRTCGPLKGPAHTLPAGPAQVGDLIILRCEMGYTSVGDLVAKCLPSTYWSSPTGFCTPKSCGSPHIPAGSKVSGSSYLFGGSVTVTCPTGFAPTIPQVIICLHNGLWSGTPSCNPFY